MKARAGMLGLAVTLIPALAFAAGASAAVEISPLVVVATTPLAGPGVAADKLAGSTETISAADLKRRGSLAITDVLEQRTPGLSLSDTQGNGFAREINYRGFSASPLQGAAQGLAVYMGGVRLNEAFGDTVNWDLIPEVAVSRIDLVTSDPAFGLNALGGALSLTMKTGRDAPGGTASVQGGSFGQRFGSIEYGATHGAFSAYVAADGGREDGWRRQSSSSLARTYGDFSWRGERGEIHLVLAGGQVKLGVVGPTPVDILAQDRRAVFTYPQTTRDRNRLVALNGSYRLSDDWSLQGVVYGRTFRQRHVDGNDGDFEGCSRQPANPLFGTLCIEDDDFPAAIRPPAAAFQVLGQDGRAVGCPPLVAGQNRLCNGVPYGTVDRTRTRARTGGFSLQAVSTAPLAGRGNVLALGGGYDRSTVKFFADSTLGIIFPDLSVRTTGDIPGVGQVIRTAGAIVYSPVALHARTAIGGLYATDTLDLTERLFLTLSARLNSQHITTIDQTGTSPDLNGRHRFTRLNPAAGLAWKVTDAITVYGGYAETNRAPTPLELSCSDPLRPCLLENALVADPPLHQVVGATWQGGLRGSSPAGGLTVAWSLGLYRSDNDNDIVALASAFTGRGYFANVPRTRRQGVEAEISWRSERWSAYASASHVAATYQFAGDLPSPNGPFADDDGNVQVTPGDRIGGVPAGRFKAGAEVMLTPRLSLGADVLGVSAQRRLGDEAGQDDRLPGYWTASAHASLAVGRGVELFGRVDNLFDRRYATFGTYFETDALANVNPSPLPADADPLTNTPAPPRSFQIGVRARW